MTRDEAMRAAAEVHRDAPWAEQPHTWAAAGADAELARVVGWLRIVGGDAAKFANAIERLAHWNYDA